MICRFLDVPSNVSLSGRTGRPSSDVVLARQAALDAAATEAARAQGSKPDEPLLITIPSLEQQTFEAGSPEAFGKAVQQSSSPRYLRPDGPAQPIFDAYIYPGTLLQFTVSAEKGAVKEELLEKYLLQLPERDKYYLDYVVSVAVIPMSGGVYLTRVGPNLNQGGRLVSCRAPLAAPNWPAVPACITLGPFMTSAGF